MIDENGNVVEPEWGILMFWEDLTAAILFLWGLIKGLFA